jgi:hypothetical protein
MLLVEFNNSVDMTASISELEIGGLTTFTSKALLDVAGPISVALRTGTEYISMAAAIEVNISTREGPLANFNISEKLRFTMNISSAALLGWIDLAIEEPSPEWERSLSPKCYPDTIENVSIPEITVEMVVDQMQGARV